MRLARWWLLPLALVLGRPAGQPTPPYRVAAIQARLFYSDRGTLSRDILQPPLPVLWNTIIGEGQSGGASSAVLVTVEVRGTPGTFEPDRKVELTVTTGRETVLRRALSLAVLDTAGRTFAGFWLYETGCRPLRLSARLLGQSASAARTASIPFACGE